MFEQKKPAKKFYHTPTTGNNAIVIKKSKNKANMCLICVKCYTYYKNRSYTSISLNKDLKTINCLISSLVHEWGEEKSESKRWRIVWALANYVYSIPYPYSFILYRDAPWLGQQGQQNAAKFSTKSRCPYLENKRACLEDQ